jgi:hypothetical protein
VGIHSTRCGTKEIKKRKYIKEKKYKKMIVKIHNNFLKKISDIYNELYESLGRAQADNIMLIWLAEIKLLIENKKD